MLQKNLIWIGLRKYAQYIVSKISFQERVSFRHTHTHSRTHPVKNAVLHREYMKSREKGPGSAAKHACPHLGWHRQPCPAPGPSTQQALGPQPNNRASPRSPLSAARLSTHDRQPPSADHAQARRLVLAVKMQVCLGSLPHKPPWWEEDLTWWLSR